MSASVLQLFREAADRHGSKTAVSDSNGKRTSYGELQVLVDRAAARIRRRTYVPGVALGTDRSLDSVIVLLAALQEACPVHLPKAGVQRPYDLLEPEEILGDSQTPHVGRPGKQPMPAAYVCYTSGTTGQPLAVAVSSDALAHRLAWGRELYPLASDDRVLWLANPSFDFSLWEVLAPLTSGATLVLSDDRMPLDLRALGRSLAEQLVTAVHFVPSILDAFLRACGPDSLAGLRYLFLGGEILDGSLLARFGALPGVRVFNQYGPTEACIDVSAHPCQPHDWREASVSIGPAAAGVVFRLLDSKGRVDESLSEGELGISGACLALGYAGDPRSSAASFVPAPSPEGRVFRTGDLVRRAGDGYRVIGRTDHLLKINGVRVDPTRVVEDIAPLVPHHRVLVRRSCGGRAGIQLTLVGTLPLDTEQEASHLRQQMRRLRPDVPVATLRFCERVPLLPTGKINQDLLDAMHEEEQPRRSALDGGSGHPQDDDGLRGVIEVWERVLGTQGLGPTSNFFESGGHSLLATELVAEMQAHLGRPVPLPLIFETDSIQELMEALHVAVG